jgi:hypothetical protein
LKDGYTKLRVFEVYEDNCKSGHKFIRG